MTPEQRLALLVAAERGQTPSRASAEHGFARLQEALSAHVPPLEIGPVDPTLLAGSTSMGKLVTGKVVAGKLITLPWVAKVTVVVGTVVTSGVLVGNQLSIATAPDRTPAAVASAATTPPVRAPSDRGARVHAAAHAPAAVDNALPPVPRAALVEPTRERSSAHQREAPRADGEAPAATPEAAPAASDTAASSASMKAFADVPERQPTAAQGFDAELVLIQRAKAEFDGGRDHLAREWLNEHARRFPAGVFAAEREGLSVLSDCRRHPSVGQAGALAFLRRYPRSPLAARIRRTCGLE